MSDEPQVTEAELHAFADGRLLPERRAAVEAWLAARAEDAERVADYHRLGGALRAAYDPLLEEPVPARLERAARRGAGWRRFAVAAGCAVLGFVHWRNKDADAPIPRYFGASGNAGRLRR